ncbi:hypothetical protein EJB05_08911 [Eragrostis curvula]|uniref:Uncharacterized protein n=1 Tax=Eragrostis curvula TaxID=38414 RepID=A0A5J9W3F7_9POAL|nr:hypothetical protein EJB05_08911 [Eragrostis curvula]
MINKPSVEEIVLVHDIKQHEILRVVVIRKSIALKSSYVFANITSTHVASDKAQFYVSINLYSCHGSLFKDSSMATYPMRTSLKVFKR